MRDFSGYDLRTGGGGSGTLASPLMGNTIVVDQVYGDDATGAVGGLPFQTVNAAVTYLNGLASIPPGGVTIWILPGSYTLTTGIAGTVTQGTQCTVSADFAQGSYLSVQVSKTAGSTAADLVVELDLF